MTTVKNRYLISLALIPLITACSSQPIIYHDDYYKDLNQAKPQQPSTSQPQTQPSNTRLSGAYANSTAAHNFIRYMVQKHRFSQSYLNKVLSNARYLESVARLENPPASLQQATLTSPRAGSWSRYRKKFLTNQHINNGVEFWRNNANTIQQASARYKVDAEYIVAIIGVETFFGRNVGKTHTLDALSTLAFMTPRRTKFFTSELENFLLMSREEKFDPSKIVGSWAGAMGLGQFMPSSFRNLAVDFNNDGKRDLWNKQDAIGSVANYFSHKGWQYNRPVTTQTNQPADPAAITLSTYSGNEIWHTYPNFKVIKRYNNSKHYAMAVYQLAQEIRKGYLGQR